MSATAIGPGTSAQGDPASVTDPLPPPPVSVSVDATDAGHGDIFVSPFGDTDTYANGADILSPDGRHVVWFHPAAAGQEISYFRAQTSFTLRAGPGQVLNAAGRILAWQHDAEAHGHGLYTVFDNEAAGAANTGTGVVSEVPYSRVVTVRIDRRARTATLVGFDEQPGPGWPPRRATPSCCRR